jgi:hypothetical protein
MVAWLPATAAWCKRQERAFDASRRDTELSTSVHFAVVDVFADAPLVGNALAVVTAGRGT